MDSECLGFHGLLHRVEQLSNPELTQQLRQLNLQKYARDAELLLYLSELDQRGLYREEAVSSLFEFCVSRLGCSEDVAYKRVGAARLMRRFPLVFDLFSAGRIHLSALMLVKPHLTEDNHREWLLAASGKSKRQVEMLVARRCPKPDVATRVRKLPEPRTSHDAETSSHATPTPIVTAPLNEPRVTAPLNEPHVSAPLNEPRVAAPLNEPHVSAPLNEPHVSAPLNEPRVAAPLNEPRVAAPLNEPLAAAPVAQGTVEQTEPVAQDSDVRTAPVAQPSVLQTAAANSSVLQAAPAAERASIEPHRGDPAGPPSPYVPLPEHANHRAVAPHAAPHHAVPPVQVKPLSGSSYRVTFTASGRLKQKLDRARELASHVISPSDLPGLIERAIDLLIEREERRRCAFGVKARATTKSHQVAADDADTKRQAGTENQAGIEIQSSTECQAESERQEDIAGRAETERQVDHLQQACPTERIGSARAQDPGRKAESNARDRSLQDGTDGLLQSTKPRSRHVPAAVRREIWKRDAGRCTFTDAQGNRCMERRFLEVEHLVPYALNGATSVENCTLRCRCHNRLTAEWIFGRRKMDSATARARNHRGATDPATSRLR